MSACVGTEIKRLKAAIRRLEQGNGTEPPPPLATGAAAVDRALPGGGLARRGLHEILAPPASSPGAAMGFAAALLTRALADHGTGTRPVLWCRPSRRGGADLYAPGLATFGLNPGRLLLLRPKDAATALWAMEEALRSGAVAAVLGEIEAPSHTAFRRLQLAAERGGVPGLLLRGGDPNRAAGPVMTRWAVRAAPSLPEIAGASWPGRPCFDVRLIKARGGAPGRWLMEWRYDRDSGAPGDFAVVAGLGDGGARAPDRVGSTGPAPAVRRVA